MDTNLRLSLSSLSKGETSCERERWRNKKVQCSGYSFSVKNERGSVGIIMTEDESSQL